MLAGGDGASMRPQHITAENIQRDSEPDFCSHASMRPQHITAENRVRGPGPERRNAALQ